MQSEILAGCNVEPHSGEQRPLRYFDKMALIYQNAEESQAPTYSFDELIYALRTAEGVWPLHAWANETVRYSINTGAPSPDDPAYRVEFSGITEMTDTMQGAAVEAFELWDDLIQIDFIETYRDPTAEVTFNYTSTSWGGTYASLIDDRSSSSENGFDMDHVTIWFADDWESHDGDEDLFLGSYAFLTYLHEIGHAVGLHHPSNYQGTNYSDWLSSVSHYQDTLAYTVMSYINAEDNGSTTDHIGPNGRSYGATPLLHDILVVQAIYGADMTTRTGPTTYGFNANAGRDAFDFSVNVDPIVAIWDAGGIDGIDVSGWSMDQTINLNEGTFSSVGHLSNNLSIAYGAVIEMAIGGGGDDRITGNGVDNVLRGLVGNDTLIAGEGNDILVGGPGGDTLHGGDGEDWARYTASTAGVVVDLVSGTGLGGDAAGDLLSGIEHVAGSNLGDTLYGDHETSNKLFGHGGDDALYGGDGHDFILAHAGNDEIYGGAGRDLMRGGTGSDYIDGGSGVDWVKYNDAASGVALDLAAGTGTSGDAAGDVLVDIENVGGSEFSDVIGGSVASNMILAGNGDDVVATYEGADIVYGEDGNDTLIAGEGNDILVGGPGGDTLHGGGGEDWARYTASTAGVVVDLVSGTGLGGDAAGDLLSGIEHVAGSNLGDTLYGDHETSNRLFGHGGDDALYGGDGHDFILAHAGNDEIYGGAGRDLMRGGTGSDYIDGGSGVDWVKYNDAASGVALDLAAGTGTSGDAAGDVLVDIENVGGSEFSDVIGGSVASNMILAGNGDDVVATYEGADIVYGEDGNDTLIAGEGNDILVGGPGGDTLHGGAGTDWASYRDATNGVAVSLLTGFGTAGDANGDVLDSIELLSGSDYSDELIGDHAANMLHGGAGDDVLTGHRGNDILNGHDGADRFIFYLDDGIDRIHGFEIGTDLIEIIGSVGSFDELLISTFKGGAAIAYDIGDVILLPDIAAEEVAAEMFEFL